ncbi:flagellar basal-body MS-ring/collar protein FliF [Sphingobium sp. B11D3D]|uniref:flagellar basal-body MS-ring/collar protein FliF n=1 Tax=Sphingobium sp. B11D3D TaxID=2940576 RepID=UPI0022256F3A|nr:flagellar basal-body MS-ring/collar protein FliF [Sphingobium sp. B11D3D]MCW2371083.1 flagellar M-ring protein FliF [Sphingobium sp. B11D3D]
MSDANITTTTGNQAAMQPGLPALSGSGAGFAAGAQGMKLRLTGLLQQPAVQRSLPMIGLITVAALAALAWLALREPPQRDLFRGLPEADQAAVAEALGKSGIAYNFDQTSGAITVAETDYFNAKMKLAAEGLPRSAPTGDTLIDSMPMGASRAVEGEKLRSAREMDLARTIEAIDAVTKARVHLAVEAPSIFLRERSRPTASVMLQLANGRSLSEGQVEAIVHLVASSVGDMAPESVSVVDQNGRLLSNATGAGAETDRQIQIQSRIEDRYRQAVTALLTPIIGAGKFSTEVHAEVNFAERQATRETYPQDEARLRAENGSWNTDAQGNANATPGGIPGALQPNPPVNPADPGGPPPTQAQAQANAMQTPPAPGMPPFKTTETFNRSFELGREVSVTRDAVGTVQRLSIAVALDQGTDGKPRTPQEIAALEALVKGAIGFDQARGDVVAISSRKFAEAAGDAATDATPWYQEAWVAMLARNVSALLVALLLLVGIGRPLLKRWSAAQAERQVLDAQIGQQIGTEIQAEIGRASAAVHDPAQPVTLDMISATHDYSDRATLIRNFVKQDPDRAALVVRDLLKDGVKADG